MTFEELDERFPNGFDDAEIMSVRIDYLTREGKLILSLRGNWPESPNRDEYRQAELSLYGLYYFSIEAPDPDRLFYPEQFKLTVDGLPEDPEQFPLFKRLQSKLTPSAFCCRFYVHDWNSFIHLAARDARFSWVDDESETKALLSHS